METCSACGRPFIVATRLLDIIDEGLYRVMLHCTNCGRSRAEVVEDAELEHLERCERIAQAQIEASLQALGSGAMGLPVRRHGR
jgi:hypothetical protein